MKLFKVRVRLYFSNSPSQIAGYPDVYVMADNEKLAQEKALTYKEENRIVKGFLFSQEIAEPFLY